MDTNDMVALIPPDPDGRFNGFPMSVRAFAIAVAALFSLATPGCAMRQPGESYDWTTSYRTVGDETGITTYIGIGRSL